MTYIAIAVGRESGRAELLKPARAPCHDLIPKKKRAFGVVDEEIEPQSTYTYPLATRTPQLEVMWPVVGREAKG